MLHCCVEMVITGQDTKQGCRPRHDGVPSAGSFTKVKPGTGIINLARIRYDLDLDGRGCVLCCADKVFGSHNNAHIARPQGRANGTGPFAIVARKRHEVIYLTRDRETRSERHDEREAVIGRHHGFSPVFRTGEHWQGCHKEN